MSEHTKGPWTVGSKSGFPVILSENTEICSPHFSKGLRFLMNDVRYRRELMANARLISAAPDGLALATLVSKYFGDGEIDPMLDCDIRLRQAARDLIAKAEG